MPESRAELGALGVLFVAVMFIIGLAAGLQHPDGEPSRPITVSPSAPAYVQLGGTTRVGPDGR